jgi:hypothetical protein
MPNYLERYLRGECEEVWAELRALGGRIRELPLYDEAQGVVRETMKRVRCNIELLVPRLTALGYRFAYPDRVFVPADEQTHQLAADVERRAGPLPLSLRGWCEVVGEVNLMGAHPKLSTYVQSPGADEMAQGFLSMFAQFGGRAAAPGDALQASVATCQRLLKEVIQGIKTRQPRSTDVDAGVRASKELLAGMMRPIAAAGPEVDSDPLVVEPYFGDPEDNMNEGDPGEGDVAIGGTDTFEAMIGPDPTHKTNHSGGTPYTIVFPDPAIDARLLGEENYGTFIDYLRTCFRWGGFPGLRASAKPPREELAFLTQGLTPL